MLEGRATSALATGEGFVARWDSGISVDTNRPADRERLKKVAKLHAKEIVELDPKQNEMAVIGTTHLVTIMNDHDLLPTHNFRFGQHREAPNLGQSVFRRLFDPGYDGCWMGCTVACSHGVRDFTPLSGPYRGRKVFVDGPEYEALGALGSLLMIFDLQAVIHANHLCNLYGLDVISMGVTLGLACELFERGLLSKADTGGLEIRYGEADLIIRLLEMMAKREGFGDQLAEGSATLAERYGVPELAVTVNRLEAPMHDPRAFSGMAVTYALSPRGACHMEGDMYGVDTGQGAPVELGVIPGDRFDDSEEKGRISARNQAWRNLADDRLAVWHHVVRRPVELVAGERWRDPAAVLTARADIRSVQRRGDELAAETARETTVVFRVAEDARGWRLFTWEGDYPLRTLGLSERSAHLVLSATLGPDLDPFEPGVRGRLTFDLRSDLIALGKAQKAR